MLIAHISKLAGRVGLHGLAPLALLTGTSEDTGFLWMGCGDNESLQDRDGGAGHTNTGAPTGL